MKTLNSLSNRAMLVTVTIRQWKGEVADKKARRTISDVHKNDTDSVRAVKKLIPDSPAFDRIDTLANALRKFVLFQTVPWFHKGTQMITSRNYYPFKSQLEKKKLEFDQAVEEFLRLYPDHREASRIRLGDLFDESDYPSVEKLRREFSVTWKFSPLPNTDDFRTQVSEEDAKALLDDMMTAEREAMRVACARVSEALSRAVEKLADPKGVFRDTLIGNIEELADVLPLLNVANDSRIDQKAAELKALASSLSPDVLRDNPQEREKAKNSLRSQLDDIESMMGAFMGGKGHE